MKKIRKKTRVVGKFGGKRIKTTVDKWSKMTLEHPEIPVSFKEDEDLATDMVEKQNEYLARIRGKLESGEELTQEELLLIRALPDTEKEE